MSQNSVSGMTKFQLRRGSFERPAISVKINIFEKWECSIFKANLGKKRKTEKCRAGIADKDAASCSLATYKFPSGDQFKYAWERKGGSRIGIRRCKREESEDEWLFRGQSRYLFPTLFLSFSLPASQPCRVGRRRWRRRMRVNLSGLSWCAIISFLQCECDARIGMPGGRLSKAYLRWRYRRETDVIRGSSFQAGIRANWYYWIDKWIVGRVCLCLWRRETHVTWINMHEKHTYLKTFG